jgi:hypothetical protein
VRANQRAALWVVGGLISFVVGALLLGVALSGLLGEPKVRAQIGLGRTDGVLSVITCPSRAIGRVIIRQDGEVVAEVHAEGGALSTVPLRPSVPGYSVELQRELRGKLSVTDADDVKGNPLSSTITTFDPASIPSEGWVATNGRVEAEGTWRSRVCNAPTSRK